MQPADHPAPTSRNATGFLRLGIARRLWLVALLLSLALTGTALYAFVSLQGVSRATDRTEKVLVPQLDRMAHVELTVTRVSLQLRHAILSRNAQELQATLEDIGHKRKDMLSTLQDFEKALSTDNGRKLHAQILPLVRNFWAVGEQNLALITSDQKEQAFAFLVERTIPARNDLLKMLSEAVQYQQKTLTHELELVQDRVRSTLNVLLALVAAAIAGLVAFSWHVARVLRRRVALSQQVAERVRDGDLSNRVHDSARDEFSPLLATLAAMQASLTRVVSEVRGNAETVARASTDIAQGNQDLARRTDEQARALQQTSSTMEELGATVRHNADNAREANQLATGASEVAVKGGEVVRQVVDTMHGIHDSAKKIVDIISVIDGIAFQTNILALNAAVEAARAGEQGRGFAVVAGEVRNLAQRSSEAAREIKGLITTSVERVEEGSALVAQAGRTMEDVVQAVQRVSGIVGEISSASAQQSAGVANVGDAMARMDEATQRNAGLVEQSAASADSLRKQAAELVRAVAVFKLDDRVAEQAPTARSGANCVSMPSARGLEAPAGHLVAAA